MDYVDHSLADIRKVLRNTEPVTRVRGTLEDDNVALETLLFPDGRPVEEQEEGGATDGGQ